MTTIEKMARDLKRNAILLAIQQEGGNRTRAAKRLGYSHVENLFRAVRTLGLKLPKGQAGRRKGAKWSAMERRSHQKGAGRG